MAKSTDQQDRRQVELRRKDGRLFRRRRSLPVMTRVSVIAASPEPIKRPRTSAAVRSVLGVFNNLPIQIKASAASALLLICLLALGTNAYLTSTRSAEQLRSLSNELIPKQQAFSQVSDAVTAT